METSWLRGGRFRALEDETKGCRSFLKPPPFLLILDSGEERGRSGVAEIFTVQGSIAE
jgi:hypothetical protein